MGEILLFQVNKRDMGVGIKEVREIIRMRKITRLPNTPEYIKGVLNLRGNIIPLVDLRLRFNFPPIQYNEFTRIVIANVNTQLQGMIVDNVEGVINIVKLQKSSIKSGVSPEFIKGIGEYNGRVIIVLDLLNLFKM